MDRIITDMALSEVRSEMLDIMMVIGDEDTDENVSLQERFDALEASISDKIVDAVVITRYMEAQADAMKAEASRITECRKTLEERIKKLKSLIGETLTKNELKIPCKIGTISRRSSSAVELSADPTTFPDVFKKVEQITKTTADKAAIKEALNNGEKLPFATLVKNFSFSVR